MLYDNGERHGIKTNLSNIWTIRKLWSRKYIITIKKKIKKYRLELYNKYKKEYNKRRRYDNPYSTVNISDYLGISNSYYQKIENQSKKEPQFP